MGDLRAAGRAGSPVRGSASVTGLFSMVDREGDARTSSVVAGFAGCQTTRRIDVRPSVRLFVAGARRVGAAGMERPEHGDEAGEIEGLAHDGKALRPLGARVRGHDQGSCRPYQPALG